jgi:ubiquinol-cytochrome c reductase cytochrome c1 subunit
VLLAPTEHVNASEDALHTPHFPWPNNKPWQAFDHASLRRGWLVYKEVCAACHSLEFIAYRNLVGTILTEDEAKAAAADNDFVDGPDKNGEMFDRPGKLTDFVARPYANDEAARSANNNALPPDLSVMIKARHGGPDYIFALLTGYRNAPAGITVKEPLHYNAYFPGSAIAMAQALHADMIEFDDGTPASISQMAKDVTHFLAWTAEPEHDERKKFGMKNFVIASGMAVATLFWKRHKFSVIKSRQIKFF